MTENTVDGTKTQRNAAHEEAKPASLFGFSTWTPVLSYAGGFEVTDYLLQVSRLLLQLGQVAQCHSLTLTLEKIFTEKHDERSLIQCTSLLAKVALLNGKHEDVVAMLLARRPGTCGHSFALQLACVKSLDDIVCPCSEHSVWLVLNERASLQCSVL